MRQTLIRGMKKAVEGMADNAALRAVFAGAGFYTLRLAYPVQYLVLRELSDCGSVLDLGCGRHSMVPILPKKIRTVGVEFFKPHYEEAVKKGRHSEYIHEDILKVSFPDKSFDAVVMLDVIEHLKKEDGLALIEKMQRWARKKIAIFTPNGFLHQDEYDENPLMAHQSGWTAEEFKKMGFRVYGVRGFKSMIPDEHGHDHDHDHENAKPSLGDSLTNLTQVITYHCPEKAFQLFTVKDVRS